MIGLEEVTVTPYNLSGHLSSDLHSLQLEPEFNGRTIGLPNADLEVMSQSERLLLEADRGKYVRYYGIALVINTHKILNRLSGRTKEFEEQLERENKLQLETKIVTIFSREILAEGLKLPFSEIDGFLSYCMVQDDFISLLNADNDEIWKYLENKRLDFRNNE